MYFLLYLALITACETLDVRFFRLNLNQSVTNLIIDDSICRVFNSSIHFNVILPGQLYDICNTNELTLMTIQPASSRHRLIALAQLLNSDKSIMDSMDNDTIDRLLYFKAPINYRRQLLGIKLRRVNDFESALKNLSIVTSAMSQQMTPMYDSQQQIQYHESMSVPLKKLNDEVASVLSLCSPMTAALFFLPCEMMTSRAIDSMIDYFVNRIANGATCKQIVPLILASSYDQSKLHFLNIDVAKTSLVTLLRAVILQYASQCPLVDTKNLKTNLLSTMQLISSNNRLFVFTSSELFATDMTRDIRNLWLTVVGIAIEHDVKIDVIMIGPQGSASIPFDEQNIASANFHYNLFLAALQTDGFFIVAADPIDLVRISNGFSLVSNDQEIIFQQFLQFGSIKKLSLSNSYLSGIIIVQSENQNFVKVYSTYGHVNCFKKNRQEQQHSFTFKQESQESLEYLTICTFKQPIGSITIELLNSRAYVQVSVENSNPAIMTPSGLMFADPDVDLNYTICNRTIMPLYAYTIHMISSLPQSCQKVNQLSSKTFIRVLYEIHVIYGIQTYLSSIISPNPKILGGMTLNDDGFENKIYTDTQSLSLSINRSTQPDAKDHRHIIFHPVCGEYLEGLQIYTIDAISESDKLTLVPCYDSANTIATLCVVSYDRAMPFASVTASCQPFIRERGAKLQQTAMIDRDMAMLGPISCFISNDLFGIIEENKCDLWSSKITAIGVQLIVFDVNPSNYSSSVDIMPLKEENRFLVIGNCCLHSVDLYAIDFDGAISDVDRIIIQHVDRTITESINLTTTEAAIGLGTLTLFIIILLVILLILICCYIRKPTCHKQLNNPPPPMYFASQISMEEPLVHTRFQDPNPMLSTERIRKEETV